MKVIEVMQELNCHYFNVMVMHDIFCEKFYHDGRPAPYENDTVGEIIVYSFLEKIGRNRGYDHKIRHMILDQILLEAVNEISRSEICCFQALPGKHYVMIPPVFESVILKDIPTENILLEYSVQSIDWNHEESNTSARSNLIVCYGHDMCVKCKNGHHFFVDMVLVTMSLGYIKKFAGWVFNPPQPKFKKTLVESIKSDTVKKMMVEFEKCIFLLELMWDREFVDDEDIKNNWHKTASFKTVADNVLMGNYAISLNCTGKYV